MGLFYIGFIFIAKLWRVMGEEGERREEDQKREASWTYGGNRKRLIGFVFLLHNAVGVAWIYRWGSSIY